MTPVEIQSKLLFTCIFSCEFSFNLQWFFLNIPSQCASYYIQTVNFKSCIFEHFTIKMAHRESDFFFTTIEKRWSSFLHFDRCVYLIIWLFVSFSVFVSLGMGHKSDKMENTLTIAWTLKALINGLYLFCSRHRRRCRQTNEFSIEFSFFQNFLSRKKNLYHFQKNSFCTFSMRVSDWCAKCPGDNSLFCCIIASKSL